MNACQYFLENDFCHFGDASKNDKNPQFTKTPNFYIHSDKIIANKKLIL